MDVSEKIGGIYYTDFHVRGRIMQPCLNQLKKAFTGDIVSVSLERPLDLGRNIVLKNEERGYPTMVKQILMALEASAADYVFFLEHDVLYHKSHFDFIPPRDDIYYYNVNNWRWHWPQDRLINYNELTSLSGMCCNRELALKHYRYRDQHIHKFGLFEIKSKEPKWARKIGYEPGTKPRRRGGLTDEEHEKRWSAFPNIDIRHRSTFSSPKVYLDNFRHPPTDWKEATMGEIEGWDLREIFNL